MTQIQTYKILFLFIIFSSKSLFAQQEKININNVIENIKIQTDRDLYFNGEQIFFNADYFINSKKQTPVLSKIVYIELINCADKYSVTRQKYKIQDYKTFGTIKIPKDVQTGNYLLRAYTQYQRNFSEYNYGCQFITILNPQNSSVPIICSNIENKDSVLLICR